MTPEQARNDWMILMEGTIYEQMEINDNHPKYKSKRKSNTMKRFNRQHINI